VYPSLNLDTGRVTTAANFTPAPHLKHLYTLLRENRFIVDIAPRDLLDKIKAGEAS
jgi:hypothetical protein